MLMNLVNIFSTEKILFDSPLLRIKAPLFEQITQKLNEKTDWRLNEIKKIKERYQLDAEMIDDIFFK